MSSGRHRIGHLARRFFGSLSRRPPSAAEEAWALGWLRPGEQALWRRLPVEDRRHALAVTRAFEALRPEADRAEMAGALLHDCGKVVCGLGTLGRVVATVWMAVVGAERARAARGRFGDYARHEPIGADLVAEAGGDPVTVALVARSAGAPADALRCLRRADDV